MKPHFSFISNKWLWTNRGEGHRTLLSRREEWWELANREKEVLTIENWTFSVYQCASWLSYFICQYMRIPLPFSYINASTGLYSCTWEENLAYCLYKSHSSHQFMELQNNKHVPLGEFNSLPNIILSLFLMPSLFLSNITETVSSQIQQPISHCIYFNFSPLNVWACYVVLK